MKAKQKLTTYIMLFKTQCQLFWPHLTNQNCSDLNGIWIRSWLLIRRLWIMTTMFIKMIKLIKLRKRLILFKSCKRLTWSVKLHTSFLFTLSVGMGTNWNIVQWYEVVFAMSAGNILKQQRVSTDAIPMLATQMSVSNVGKLWRTRLIKKKWHSKLK